MLIIARSTTSIRDNPRVLPAATGLLVAIEILLHNYKQFILRLAVVELASSTLHWYVSLQYAVAHSFYFT